MDSLVRINENLHNKQISLARSKLNIFTSLAKIRIFAETNGCNVILKGFIVYSESILHEHFSSSDSFQILVQNYLKCGGFTMGD